MIIETITVILAILAAIGAWSLVGMVCDLFNPKKHKPVSFVGTLKEFHDWANVVPCNGDPAKTILHVALEEHGTTPNQPSKETK